MSRLRRATNLLQYFTCHEFTFHSTNVAQLHTQLSGSDKATFNFDLSDLHWPTYMENYCLGTRHYALKELPCTLPASRTHLVR